MCDQCQQLESKIQRYRRFITQGLDALTIERVQALIQDLEARKGAMHSRGPSSLVAR